MSDSAQHGGTAKVSDKIDRSRKTINHCSLLLYELSATWAAAAAAAAAAAKFGEQQCPNDYPPCVDASLHLPAMPLRISCAASHVPAIYGGGVFSRGYDQGGPW